jgi:hypothetical protein
MANIFNTSERRTGNQPTSQMRLIVLENIDFLLSKCIKRAKSKLSVDIFVFKIGWMIVEMSLKT